MRGFNLIELMVALVIISVLMIISVPIYSHYFQREDRFAAETSLLKLAAALENYYIEHNSYDAVTLEKLGFREKVGNDHYELGLAMQGATGFVLSATPLQNETACGVLTLDSQGEKGVSGNGGVDGCW